MSQKRNQEITPAPLIERVLAIIGVTCIVLAVVCYLTGLFVTLFFSRQTLADGFWTFVAWFSYIGMPFGFLCVLTLLFLNLRRRSREQREAASKHSRPASKQSRPAGKNSPAKGQRSGGKKQRRR